MAIRDAQGNLHKESDGRFTSEGACDKQAEYNSTQAKHDEKKAIFTADKSRPKRKETLYLDKKEYGKMCSIVRTRYADKIPRKGHVFSSDCLYIFGHSKETNRIVFYSKISIAGHENLINEILEEIKK